MNVQALLCLRCGGPLTRPAQLPALVDCVFCGATMSLGQERAVLTQEATQLDVVHRRRQQFHDALVAALQAGRSPFDAIRDAAVAHLALGAQAETAARIAVALVHDFEAEAGLDAATQPQVLARIVEAYLRALDELRTHDRAELNLPFLWADAAGPRHLQRTVTARLLAELAARDPAARAPVAPPAPEPAPEPTTPEPAPAGKRPWWRLW